MANRTAQQIINTAGGSAALAGLYSKEFGKDVHPSTIQKWINNGIPEKNWAVLIQHFGECPDELHAINEEIRGKNKAA